MHHQFKTQKFKHLMLAMGPRDLNSAPYSPVHCSSHSMTSFQSSELTELPVVENSQLFAQRTVRPHNCDTRTATTGGLGRHKGRPRGTVRQSHREIPRHPRTAPQHRTAGGTAPSKRRSPSPVRLRSLQTAGLQMGNTVIGALDRGKGMTSPGMCTACGCASCRAKTSCARWYAQGPGATQTSVSCTFGAATWHSCTVGVPTIAHARRSQGLVLVLTRALAGVEIGQRRV